MATENGHATAAARSFTVNGTEYFITPLTQGEWGEYLAWVVDTWLDVQKRNAKDLQPEDRQAILKQAFEAAGKMHLGSPESRSITQTPAGIYRMVWMHLRRRHPQISFDEVAEVLSSDELMASAMEKVEKATVNSERAEKKAGGRARTARRPARRR